MRVLFALCLFAFLVLSVPRASAEEELYFRSISSSGGVFVFVVGGVAGTRYRLESSTDLKDWTPRGEGEVVAASPGGPQPPAGFVHLADEGPSFYVRLVKL